MQFLSEKSDAKWLPAGSSVRIFRTAALPAQHLTTSAYVMLFRGEDILLIQDRERGWDIPGGHREEGETVEQCAARELLEEGAARAKKLVPFARVEVRVSEPVPAGYKYPAPSSYMQFYIATLGELLPFEGKFETANRIFVAPCDAERYQWIQSHRALYDAAIECIRKFNSYRPS